MLQFEFDIRNHKINNNKSRQVQLALTLAFFIVAVLFCVFKNYLDFFPFWDYLVLVLVVLGIYFGGLLLGFKFLHPKEYLTINSRKLTYKLGWKKKETKVYLKNIKEIRIINNNLVLLLRDKEELRIDLTNFSDNAISVLKNYLNLAE